MPKGAIVDVRVLQNESVSYYHIYAVIPLYPYKDGAVAAQLASSGWQKFHGLYGRKALLLAWPPTEEKRR